MCTITATEFKTNFGKYLNLAKKEEIAITKNGKLITTLTPPKSDCFEEFLDSITGLGKEEELDFNDPRVAGVFGKLWDYLLIQIYF